MSLDNRTELNDCDDATGFVADGLTPAANTLAGQRYEGTASIHTQHSDTDEHMYTTQLSGGGGTFSRDLSDSTCYILVKDNLVESAANGGVQITLYDGTDDIGYDVGGNDSVGLSLNPFFNCYKLDISSPPASFTVFAGVEADLTTTAITGMGYGSLHSSKAQGNVANVFLDRMTHIVNGSAALTINGGSSGTPETMIDVQGDDVTNGWGMVSNPQGSLFNFFAPTEWGDTAATADSYFTATDEQWFWVGGVVAAGNFSFAVVGNATDTNSFVLDTVSIVGIGTRAEFDMSDTDIDTLQLTSVTFTDIGAITFQVQDASNKFLTNCIFNNCAQLDPSTMDMDSITFNGTTDANGALLLDEATANNMSDLTFVSDGTGHAIYVNPTGAGPFTYNLDNWQFSGYGADDTTDAEIFFDPVTTDADATFNIQNGGKSPTVRKSDAGSTVTINNAVSVTVEGVSEGAPVVVVANETVGTITEGDVIFEQFADSNGTAEITDFNYESAFNPSGLDIIVRARSSGNAIAAIQDDNGSYTDQTEESNNSTTDDMLLLPTVPVVNEDRYLLGHTEQFGQLKLDVSVAGTGGFTITWQYWNGAWTSLSGVSDGTNSFSTLGENIVSWTIPGDWATTTINSQGPFYYVRAAYTAGSVTIVPKGKKCTLDVIRYIPFAQNRIIESTGLVVVATWVEDTIASF